MKNLLTLALTVLVSTTALAGDPNADLAATLTCREKLLSKIQGSVLLNTNMYEYKNLQVSEGATYYALSKLPGYEQKKIMVITHTYERREAGSNSDFQLAAGFTFASIPECKIITRGSAGVLPQAF